MHWTLLFSSFPCPSVSAAHHASHCPPNAPLSLPQSTLGSEQKQRAGLLAWRSGSWPYIPKKVEGPLSFTTVRRALCC